MVEQEGGEQDRSGGSGALDCYVNAGRADSLPRPLLFHHIRKTGGSSFRAAVARALVTRGFTLVQVPDVKARLRASGKWPNGLNEIVGAIPHVQAILSHYTAFLDDARAPILTLIREPEARFWSAAAFVGPKVGEPPKAIARRLANAQMRSLTGLEIPPWKPEDVSPWLELVGQVMSRFTIFTLERFDALLAHCREEYGLTLAPLHKKRGSKVLSSDLRAAIEVEMTGRDPLWLDRVLYERVLPAPHGQRLRKT